MNKILAMLLSNLKTLELLIDATTDETLLKAHILQRDETIKDIGKEELREENEKAAVKIAEAAKEKALIDKAAGSKLNGQPNIEVGDPDNYKGFNLKAVIGNIDVVDGVSEVVKRRLTARPEAGFKTLKMFTDMLKAAEANPMRYKAAMEEEAPSEGGYLTPTEQRAELLSYVRETSITMGDVTHISMNSDVMTVSKELANVGVAWTDEEVDATESEPTFEQVTLTAKRLDAYSTSSNELLEDNNTPGGITAVLLSQFTEAVAKELDNQVLTGTGAPISGVFTAKAGYSEVFSAGSTAFSELLESNVRALIGKIPPERLDGAKWYMHNTLLWNYFYGLKDTQGRPLFIPSMSQGVPGTLFGYPVKQSSQATSASAADATLAAFGNLKGFYVGDRLTNIKLMMDPYTLGKSYQTNFYFFTRWAFAHALPKYYGRIVTAES